MAMTLTDLDEHQPHFVSEEEGKASGDRRIRIGSPDFYGPRKSDMASSPFTPYFKLAEVYGSPDPIPLEYYQRRYSELLAGLPIRHFSLKDFLCGYSFEIALADLRACLQCDNYTDSLGACRTSWGNGGFLDFDREKYDRDCRDYMDGLNAKIPTPRFRICRCPGQKQRVAALANFYRRVMYA